MMSVEEVDSVTLATVCEEDSIFIENTVVYSEVDGAGVIVRVVFKLLTKECVAVFVLKPHVVQLMSADVDSGVESLFE